MPYWEKAMSRIPILKDAIYPTLTNSPDTFTPNGKWILGETPEVKYLFYYYNFIKLYMACNVYLMFTFSIFYFISLIFE